MSDGLTKYLRVADPFHEGLTSLGMAMATVLTGGLGSGLVGGGYVLYRGTASDAITTPVGAAAAGARTIRPWAFVPQTAEERYWFRCAAVGAGGVEAVDGTAPPITCVQIGDDGQAPQPVPPGPRGLSVAAVAGGKFRLAWEHWPTANFAAAAQFRVYADGGTETMDWVTSIATVRVRLDGRQGAGSYGLVTPAFGHGLTVQFGVRARTAAGYEEQNTTVVSAIADSMGPADWHVTAAAYGEDV